MTRPTPRGSLMGEGRPDPLAVPGRAPSVLAFHGFGSTPQEMALIVGVSERLGLAAEAPLLPGHGERVAALAKLRFADWMAAAEEHYQRLSARGPVILAGLSMGSLLAFRLALRYPENVLGVIALANAVWLRSPWPAWGLRVVDRCRLPDFWVPKSGPDIEDREQRALHLTYNAQPVHAAVSVLRAGEQLVPELHKVRCPTLLVHGELDGVTPVSNAWRVAVRLGSTDKRVVVLPRSRHIVTRDVERETVQAEVSAFLRQRLGGASAAHPL